MKITWLGHSSFLLETGDGTRVLTDPFEAGSYDGAIGYPPISERADLVTVSHDHPDHNAIGSVPGHPEVVRGSARRSVKGVTVEGIPTFHDDSQGRKRGANTVYVLEADGMRFAHLGDLGHELSKDEADALGKVDVLFVPVGGHFTIGPAEAKRVAERVGAPVVIPMHYKTKVLGFPIGPVDDFVKLMPEVERPGKRSVELHKEDLSGRPRVIVLEYE